MAIGKTYANGKVTGIVKEGESSQGKPRYEVGVKLDSGEDVYVFLYMSPDAAKYSAEKLQRLGWDGASAIGPQIKDKPCRICIKIEEWEGKETAPKYDFVRAEKEVTGDTKASMFESLKAAAKEAGAFPVAEASKPAKPLF